MSQYVVLANMTKRVTSSTTAATPAKRANTRGVAASKPEQNAYQRGEAVRWLGFGASQKVAAARVGVTLRTVQRWMADAKFLADVEAERLSHYEQISDELGALIRHAMAVMHQALSGEVKVSDGAYITAEKLLNRFVASNVQAVDAPPGAPPSANQININLNGPEPERPSRRIDPIEAA